MADVSRNRAQLVIVGGLVIAVALVAVGLLLNFAIYTENLATREGNTEASAAVEQRDAAVNSVAQAMEYVNTHEAGSGTGVMRQQLLDQIAVFNESMRERGAISGAAVEVTDVETTNGSRMRQTDFGRTLTDFDQSGTDDPGVDLTDGGQDPNWRLVENVRNTSRFRMELNRTSLEEVSRTDTLTNVLSLEEPYHVRIENSSGDVWEVYMYRDGSGTAYLAVEEPGSSLSGPLLALSDMCLATADNITVDLVNNQFGSSRSATATAAWQIQPNSIAFSSGTGQTRPNCPALSFFPNDVGDDYTIGYRDGDKAEGTYDLVVNSTDFDSNNFADPGSGQPFAYEALFTATVNVSYRSSDVAYTDSVETGSVANLSDFPGISPEVTEFDVSDDVDPDDDEAEFTVDWTVDDGDDDIQKVNVTLIDRDDNSKTVTETYTTSDTELSSSSGSDTTTLEDTSADDPDEYTIRITVFDDEGNIATRTEVKNNDT